MKPYITICGIIAMTMMVNGVWTVFRGPMSATHIFSTAFIWIAAGIALRLGSMAWQRYKYGKRLND